MACPTCDHTMEQLGRVNFEVCFLCPRCGTVKVQYLANPNAESVYVPKLVERCRNFETDSLLPLLAVSGEIGKLWHRLGIAESINLPEKRTY